jgi:hypothetical protein
MKHSVAFVFAVAAACTGSHDDSLYLTGTEESFVTLPDGTKACTNPKKVLICHVPPGNPANAHTICVGRPATNAHQTHHGDLLGACESEPEPPPDEPPPPDQPSPNPV